MFAVNVKRFYFICDKVLLRNFRNGSKLNVRQRNPGLDSRLKAFQEDGVKFQDDDAEEFIEQSESSFYNVDEAYNEHLNETLIGKYDMRHKIVKEKYFKENMPNLLTWSEKEQIRHLATTQPDEWTPQKIAESFPVTEQVVKKLLKYPWKPATNERIARHDASAMRNWRELKEGSLTIADNLKQHFLKFSDRTIPPLNRKSVKLDISQESIGEYENIIKKYASHEKPVENNMNSENNNLNLVAINKTKPKQDFEKVTLNELATKIKSRLDHGQEVDVPDKIIVDSITSINDKSVKIPELSKEIDLVPKTKEDKSLTGFKENDKNVNLAVTYPERIRIPRKAYKKGATYKMNDCFYDDDGRFMYRVIGMDNSN